MRLAFRMFHTRNLIPYVCSGRPNIFKWRGAQPKRKLLTSISDFATERMGTSTVERKIPTMSDSNIIWIDMEMTGLDSEKDCILEAACLITDKDINIIAEGPNVIIHQPLEKLSAMNEWCLEHHTKSGLFKSSLDSKVSLEQAEDELLKFIQQYTPQGKCPLAGNSVYMDKLFLLKYMPRFCEHLHYRILDVSTVKILAKSWYNLDPPKKVWKHRALEDIKESIEELTYYQKCIFKPVESISVKSSLK